MAGLLQGLHENVYVKVSHAGWCRVQNSFFHDGRKPRAARPVQPCSDLTRVGGQSWVGFETPDKVGRAARAAWQCPSPSLQEIHCVGKKEAALKQGTGQGWER